MAKIDPSGEARKTRPKGEKQMKFLKKGMRLITVKTVTKEGKTFSFVKLADKESFDNGDFMLSRKVDPTKLSENNDYNVILEIDGKYSTVELQPV